VQQVTIFEDEWRLLAELADGFRRREYDLAALAMATEGLLHIGLAEETSEGLQVTALGHQVRAEAEAFVGGGPRIWFECGVSSSAFSEKGGHSDGRSGNLPR
jgi:hypothetical protein